ncbi:MAG: T9SS type A sorting domain-containing protein [Saprospiraceae bacterium]|nr:T9SS type A sorting domain-containing protein [Saprospiraceae bacterium]MCF8251018.1 T9SS type A sorting domain-containing protein [Saprospiraceae bacterium]MCF8311615.1 T9SS type A sorting domain-containing protein [Saprospiraceae bacterium]MCF8440956.1 T9SS type A sorting domain-containing protein [Saprospiraceae bacterium]
MKRLYFPFFALIFCFAILPEVSNAQCTTWSAPTPPGTYNDFNGTFLGAPCDSGNGCPFNEITAFQVFASEAYICNNFLAGGTYAFSICNGPGAGTWVPEFTIIAPSGAVDAFGPGDGDGCTITWTASENGNYTIVINEAGHCPGGPNTATSNGYPALTCISGAVCTGDICAAGELTTTGAVSACGTGATFDIATDGSQFTPPNGGHGWYFDDALGGTGGLAGGFTLTNMPFASTLNADLNGVLSQNSLPILAGVWVVKSVAYVLASDPSGTVCSTSMDSLIVSFSPTAPPSVTVVDNGNSSATATGTGGTGALTYLWSNGQTTATATGLPTGDYSVVVTDANGCTGMASVSVVAGIGNISSLESLSISPNPTSGLFLVKMELNSVENVAINVLDVTGKLVARAAGTTSNGQFTFDLSDQAAGVYLLKLTVGGETLARKLVLTR